MSASALLSLLIPGAYTVSVKFSEGTKAYTYLCDIPGVQVGDYLIVRVGSEVKMVQAFRVDSTPMVNFADGSIKYRWIGQKVDLSGLGDKEAKLAELEAQINLAEHLSKQQQALLRYQAMLPEGTQARTLVDEQLALLLAQQPHLQVPVRRPAVQDLQDLEHGQY